MIAGRRQGKWLSRRIVELIPEARGVGREGGGEGARRKDSAADGRHRWREGGGGVGEEERWRTLLLELSRVTLCVQEMPEVLEILQSQDTGPTSSQV